MYYFFTQSTRKFEDYSDVFAAIDIPVSVIWGIHDDMLQWTPQQTRIATTFDIPEERIHLVDEKHFIQETKNKYLVKLLLNLK